MNEPASEATILAIENRVSTLLADKLAGSAIAIVGQKYLTGDNHLITVTMCSVAESSIPRVRIQVFERVTGGVVEHSYALFADRRFELVDNPMIFGKTPEPNSAPRPVDEPTAATLLASLERISQSDQHLT